jgi:hypothetical protein
LIRGLRGRVGGCPQFLLFLVLKWERQERSREDGSAPLVPIEIKIL